MGANVFTYIALAAFVPATYACFRMLGPQRGVVAALLGGWLLLPAYGASIGFPVFHEKAMLVPGVVFLASVVLDWNRWRGLRPCLLDLPAVVLAVTPVASAFANDMDIYEASSALLQAATIWGAPYLLGRVYLASPRALTHFLAATAAAAVLYVPLCAWEMRMSPTLQHTIYGFSVFTFAQSVRFGGYRPTVFLGHGLALAMFLASATLFAYWLWRSGYRRRIVRLSPGTATAVLLVTTVATRSTGAIVLLACGIGVLEATLRLRTRIFVLTLMALPTLYVAYRVSGWSGEDVVRIVTETISAERAESIAYRLRNENLLVEKALQRPAFGWGRWGRFFVTDRAGRPVSVPDGMWVIRLGSTGLVGLAALGLFIALPALALLRRVPPRAWKDPRVAPAAAAAVVLLLWGVDDVLNSFLNPVFMLVAGALTGLCHGSAELAPRRSVGAGGGPGLPRAAPWRPTPGAAPP